jgi:ribosomal protein L37AE/L43A
MKGWVYIITNKSMPNLVKVGFTTKDDSESRAKELNHTNNPHPYVVEYEALVNTARSVEQKAHALLKKYHENKEWFRCDIATAIIAIRQAANNSIIAENNKNQQRQEIEKEIAQRKKEEDIEKQLISEEKRIRELYKQKIEQQFPFLAETNNLSLFFWIGGEFLVFIAIISLFSDVSWTKFFISIFLAYITGGYLAEYFVENQKKSPAYLSLIKKMEEELARVREQNIKCPECAMNIRFDRKMELLDTEAKWNCPHCKSLIISPYSPNYKPASIPRTNNVVVQEQTAENSGCLAPIFLYLVFSFPILYLFFSSSNSPTTPVAVPTRADNSFVQPPMLKQETTLTPSPKNTHRKSQNTSKHRKKNTKHKKAKQSVSSSDLRFCLELPSDEAIARCVENNR